MVAVCWLLRHVSDVPAHDDWLSPREHEALAKYWAPKRRRDWRLGRWTGKEALLRAGIFGLGHDWHDTDRARITIAADDAGVPRVLVDETGSDWVLSLSHTGEHGLCAVARAVAAVGCDVETLGRRGDEFVVDWFTPAERAMVEAASGDARSRVVTLVWSAKESALKALGVGLRMDTREVEVTVPAGRDEDGGMTATNAVWRPLEVRAPGGTLRGWWQSDGERMVTVVSDPPSAKPTALVE